MNLYYIYSMVLKTKIVFKKRSVDVCLVLNVRKVCSKWKEA